MASNRSLTRGISKTRLSLNLRDLKYSNVWIRYFAWNWNSTWVMLLIHWQICSLLRSENLRAQIYKLARPIDPSNTLRSAQNGQHFAHDIFICIFLDLSVGLWVGIQFVHYGDVTMSRVASQITSLTSVYSTVCTDTDQRKHQSSALLAFVRGIHRGPVNSLHKWPVTRKMFPFDDVIMWRVGSWDVQGGILVTPEEDNWPTFETKISFLCKTTILIKQQTHRYVCINCRYGSSSRAPSQYKDRLY